MKTIKNKEDLNSFKININLINLQRVKLTTLAFIFIEIVMLIIYVMNYWGHLWEEPQIFYGSLYLLMLTFMTIFHFLFAYYKKNVEKNIIKIRALGVIFISFILLWCATISILDSLSPMVYVVAVIMVAVVPFCFPATIGLVYIVCHVLFLIFLSLYTKEPDTLFSIYVNTTIFVVLSWVISFMRINKQIEDFYKQKMIDETNEKIRQMNNDLTEANKKLAVLSFTDQLSGIYNYAMYKQKINEEWEASIINKSSLSLLIVDIDNFKLINDTYGHLVGDAIIRNTAQELKNIAKCEYDFVARYGGDEFVVILPMTSKFDAVKLACEICKRVETMDKPTEIKIPVTISVGVNAMIPTQSDNINDFIHKTDMALYKAKKQKNKVEIVEND